MSTPLHYRALTLLCLTLAASSAAGQGLGGFSPAPDMDGLSFSTGMDI